MSTIQFSILFALFATSMMITLVCFIQVSNLSSRQARLTEAIECAANKIEEGNKNLNDAFNHIYGLHGWYVPSIKYLLVALAKYIEEMRNQAIKEERYEEARKCNEAIKEMNKLIEA